MSCRLPPYDAVLNEVGGYLVYTSSILSTAMQALVMFQNTVTTSLKMPCCTHISSPRAAVVSRTWSRLYTQHQTICHAQLHVQVITKWIQTCNEDKHLTPSGCVPLVTDPIAGVANQERTNDLLHSLLSPNEAFGYLCKSTRPTLKLLLPSYVLTTSRKYIFAIPSAHPELNWRLTLAHIMKRQMVVKPAFLCC